MKALSKVSVLALAVTIGVASLISGCGGGGGGTPAPSAKTTLSGKLYSGTVSGFSADVAKTETKAITPATALPGYQLYCVTFATTPVAASGTSGADGSVTLTLAVASADLGCFVLDGSGTSVASLIFTNSSLSQAGQTASVSGSVDFGTITVSLDAGVAAATVPSGVTIVTTTPSGASCPEGSWFATDIGYAPPCPVGQDTEASVWIVKKPDGTYGTSFTVYNAGIDFNGVPYCTVGSKSDIPSTAAGNAVSMTFNFNFEVPDPCPQKIATVTVTPNADCMTGTISGHIDNCGSCTPAPCVDCGTTTCPFTATMTRQ